MGENVDFILKNIKPLLDKVKLNTYKANTYNIMIKVCELIKIKGYKSDEAFIKIVEIAYDSNKKGKRRKTTKEQLIKKINEKK